MKKMVIIVAILLSPALSFADYQVGIASAFGIVTVVTDQRYDTLTDLVFGLESRYRTSIFQFGATALYSPIYFENGAQLTVRTDVGLSFDIQSLRLGVAIGPDFWFSFADNYPPSMTSWNVKLSTDINIDRISLGIMAFYNAELLDRRPFPSVIATIMLKLF